MMKNIYCIQKVITEIMTYDKTDKIIKYVFESLYKRYQIGLETSMEGGDLIFDCANLLYYKCQ